MTRFEEARHLAQANPMLSQAEIARAVGLSRQGVNLALKRTGITVRNGRGDPGLGRGRGGRTTAIAEASRKMEARLPLTREERHLLWQEYRRRQRESAA